MNHTPFILAAYLLVGIGTALLILASYLSMRRAERRVDDLRGDR